jgi:hypothetical protein
MSKFKSYVLLMSSVVAVVLLCLMLNFTRVQAQTSMQDMDHSSVEVIDGSLHPEKIKDEDAYRMFFLAAVAKDSSSEEIGRQRGMFYALNLNEEQYTLIAEALANFAAGVDSATDQYNQDAEANGDKADHKAYRNQVKSLVAEAETRIELIIGLKNAGDFHAFIQGEKQKMQIAVEE